MRGLPVRLSALASAIVAAHERRVGRALSGRARAAAAARSSTRTGSPAGRSRRGSNPVGPDAAEHRCPARSARRREQPGSRSRSTSTRARSAQVADPHVRRRSARPGQLGPHGQLGPVDPGQRLAGDRHAVRDPAGQAGRGRLVPGRPAPSGATPRAPGPWSARRRAAARWAPRSSAARMPGPEAGRGRRRRWCPSRRRRRRRHVVERGEYVDELGLAEVATVSGVGDVAVAVQLVGRRRDVPDAEAGGEGRGAPPAPRSRARATPRSRRRPGPAPSARTAAARTKAESAPPENATTSGPREPSSRRSASSAVEPRAQHVLGAARPGSPPGRAEHDVGAGGGQVRRASSGRWPPRPRPRPPRWPRRRRRGGRRRRPAAPISRRTSALPWANRPPTTTSASRPDLGQHRARRRTADLALMTAVRPPRARTAARASRGTGQQRGDRLRRTSGSARGSSATPRRPASSGSQLAQGVLAAGCRWSARCPRR